MPAKGVMARTLEAPATEPLSSSKTAELREVTRRFGDLVALERLSLSVQPGEPFASLDAITRGSLQEWLADALRAEPRTVVLVTHDVQEALYLADRVVVLSPRPGHVVAELAVPLARPRPRRQTVTSPEF